MKCLQESFSNKRLNSSSTFLIKINSSFYLEVKTSAGMDTETIWSKQIAKL